MASPSEEQRKRFGPKVAPFERKLKIGITDKVVKQVHANRKYYDVFGHDARDNNLPDDCRRLSAAEMESINRDPTSPLKREKCYLWILDDDGVKILWEGINNLEDEEAGLVKHTNITGGSTAYLGGEMYFEDGVRIHINTRSDRYGGHPREFEFENEWHGVLQYIQAVFMKYEIVPAS